MKIMITMKDPDGVYDSVGDVATTGHERDEIMEILKKWFVFDEYLTVEVDTDEKTIKVVENT